MTDHPLNPSSPTPALRPSACPGLWRIVQALDGGISRIKLDAGHLEADQAEAVAAAAERFAGGVIEVTNRSNLQIRGVGHDHQGLVARLLDAGLGPREAAGDDVRNLMLSPAAGLDPAMLLDTRPLGARILDLLQTTPRFHELSAKFAVQLDGGENLAMLWHPHDLWLSPLLLDDQLWLAFGLAGCPGHDAPLAAVPLDDGLALVRAVLERFLDLADAGQSRMRQLLSSLGVEPFLDGLALELRRDSAVTSWRRQGLDRALHLGIYPQRQPGRVAVGALAPLGRLDAVQLRGIAALARELGDGSLRMTPWQSVLLPNVAAAQAERVLADLACLGLVGDPAAPMAGVVACTGSAGCARGLADTKADAVQLAHALHRRGPVGGVHLSGCKRSCAMAHTAPSTLLAVGPGRYDLYFHDPAQPGPGTLAGRNLTLEEAGATLDARHGATLDD
ncbi:precorrin-3B synthase [Pseudomonas sp. GD04058]|uniref:precorrin-3B synthase n=1 Tax=Pseudomonas sp. GD04058 TaxID=2975429 RepID=UPI002449C11B|nr:precorrin-3B synthase [Pseudomonas sp. GD04058]MDG9881287.1 precorrin-3B synthase [Pseudomonas sp. GD04058]